MAVRAGMKITGLDELNKNLAELADYDTKGSKWKRKAFTEAGDLALKPVVRAVKSKAPDDSGKTRSAISLARGKYTPPSKVTAQKAFTKTGRLKKGYRYEYIGGVGVPRDYGDPVKRRTKKRKGKFYRYGFALEAGIKEQTYIRISKKGKIHEVDSPKRPAMKYWYNSFQERERLMVRTFINSLKRNVNTFLKKKRPKKGR